MRAAVRGALVCSTPLAQRLREPYRGGCRHIACVEVVPADAADAVGPHCAIRSGRASRATGQSSRFLRGDWTRLLRKARANSGKPDHARSAQDAETRR